MKYIVLCGSAEQIQKDLNTMTDLGWNYTGNHSTIYVESEGIVFSVIMERLKKEPCQ